MLNMQFVRQLTQIELERQNHLHRCFEESTHLELGIIDFNYLSLNRETII